jgi:hypothetical protein
MCVPSMGIWYRRYHNIPEGANPLQASWRSLLASRKVVCREIGTERSETAKSGTDGQKQDPMLTTSAGPHKRPAMVGEQAHLCEALGQQTIAGRCRRNRRKEYALTWGDLEPYVLWIEKSAAVVVVGGNELS